MKKKYCLISLATVLICLGTLIGCGDKTTPTDENTNTSSTENKDATNTESSNKENNTESKENLNKENSEDKANTANNDKNGNSAKSDKDSTSSKSDKDSKTIENSNESKNNENKGTDSKKEKSALPKTKSEYLSKMQDVDNESSTLDKEYKTDEGMTQAGMNIISGKQAKLYDDELNRIYKFLKQNLSDEKFKELEKSEVEWINQKEKRVESIKKEFEGGSMLPLQVNSAVAEESKNRCYYLINNYME